MDLSWILLWLAGILSVSLLVQFGRRGLTRARGWAGVLVAVPLVGVGTWFLQPAWAGYVAALVLVVFVMIPLAGVRRMNRFAAQMQYGRAVRVARIVRLLHPFDGFWAQPRAFSAIALAQEGKVDAALALLEAQAGEARAPGRSPGKSGDALLLKVQAYRVLGRWDELVSLCDSAGRGALGGPMDPVLPLYLRALGEVGRIDDLIARCRDLVRLPAMAGAVGLYVAGFTGDRQALARLRAPGGPLALVPPSVERFWQATAAQAAGDPDGEAEMRRLAETADNHDALVRSAAAYRLAHPIAVRGECEGDRALVAEALRQLDAMQVRVQRVRRRPGPVTLLLIAANVAMFVVELVRGASLSGGDSDLPVLFRLGAFVPEAVAHGQVWRALTGMFMHFGFLHITLNMAGLYFLGRDTERDLGRVRYAIVYLVAGLGAFAVYYGLWAAGVARSELLVGASGCIMGLIGARVAVLLRGRAGVARQAARREILGLLVVIAAQTVFDLLTPSVSFTAHAAGVVFGFLAALVLAPAPGGRPEALRPATEMK
jgi:rhomboid protease GluP